MRKVRPKKRSKIINIPTKGSITVLGLDCSSSTVGWGFVYLKNKEIKLSSYGHIKPLKSDKYTLIERLHDLYNQIQSLCIELKPDFVVIEDIVLFMSRKSHAKTITVLAGFNRVAALAAYNVVNNLQFYSVHEIRKLVKNAYLDKKSKISKEDMPNLIKQHLNNTFEGPTNLRGDVAVEIYDEADGIAVAWAKAIEIRGKNEKPI